MKSIIKPSEVRHERGFTLVEIMIALGVMVVVLVGLLSAILYASRQNAINRENLAAMRGAEQMLEHIRARTFLDIFDCYDDEDDVRLVNVQPWPAGIAWPNVDQVPYPDPLHPEPGPWFNVTGLRPPAGRPAVGRILFPGSFPTAVPSAGPPPVLREGRTGDADFDFFLKVDAANIGANPTGRDLDLDGLIDEADISNPAPTYQLLPVCIELQWGGITGQRTVRYYHLLRQR